MKWAAGACCGRVNAAGIAGWNASRAAIAILSGCGAARTISIGARCCLRYPASGKRKQSREGLFCYGAGLFAQIGVEHPDLFFLLFDVIAHQRRGAFVTGVCRYRQQFTLLLQQD